MSFGQIVYASLAQMAVTGQANTQINDRSVGTLDIFSSAFWTHPTFANTMCRLTDDTTEIYYSPEGNRQQNAKFQPPRSLDVLYNMFIVIDLPGLVEEIHPVYTHQDGTANTQKMEVLNYNGFSGIGTSVNITANTSLSASLEAAGANDARLKAEFENLSWGHTRYWVQLSDGSAGYTSDGESYTDIGGKTQPSWPAGTAKRIELTPFYGNNNVFEGASDVLNSSARYFATRADGSIARYKNAVGQALIESVEMTVGGTQLAKLTGTWLYVHEELHGMVGRTLYEMVGNEPDADVLARDEYKSPQQDSLCRLEAQSQIHRRLYVPIPFWFTGGKMDRALKLIGMQLHRMEFNCRMNDLGKVIYRPSGAVCHLPLVTESDGVWKPTGAFGLAYPSTFTPVENWTHSTADNAYKSAGNPSTYVMARYGETMNATLNEANMKAVRGGGAVSRMGTGAKDNLGLNTNQGQAKFTIDFHGLFLNNKTRTAYLNLEEQTLFSQLQTQSDQLASSYMTKRTNLTFQNAVYEIVIAAKNANEKEKDGWGLGGTDRDNLGCRHDMIDSLDFRLAATPRTQPGLEGAFYRHVTQFQAADKTSDKKGIYFYPLYEKKELNNIRLVSSYINCSKVDDLKLTMKPTNHASAKNAEVEIFAQSYNLMHVKNGMVGKLFQ